MRRFLAAVVAAALPLCLSACLSGQVNFSSPANVGQVPPAKVSPNLFGANLQSELGTQYYCLFGDSRSAFTGPSSHATAYNSLFAAAKGWTEMNYATSGYDQADLFQTIVAQSFGQTNSSSTCATNILWIGVNGGVGQYHEEAAWLADALWISAPDAGPSGVAVKQRGTQAAKTGTGWQSSSDHYASGIKTINAGDTATGTVMAKTAIYPIVSYSLHTNFTWCFAIDAQPQVCHGPMGGTGTFQTNPPYEYYANSHGLGLTYWPYAVRENITGYASGSPTVTTNNSAQAYPLAATPHTWTFTCQSTGGSACYLEGVVGDGVDQGLTGMQTWILSDFRGTGGGAPSGLVNAAAESRLVAQMARDGFNVDLVPIGDVLDCVITTADCADGLHPSDQGSLKIANRLIAETSSLVTPRDREAMKSFDDQTPLILTYNSAANYTGNELQTVAVFAPLTNVRLVALTVQGPNFSTCSVAPTIVVAGAGNSYTLTAPYGNISWSAPTGLDVPFYGGSLAAETPISITVNGIPGCTVTTAGNLIITAQFFRY